VSFRHALVQDVAYESLPFSRRRLLHGAVGRYLEALPSPADHAVLVHHYRLAGDSPRTRLHAVRASESSVAAYANLEAVDYLSVALAATRAPTSGEAAIRSRLEELMGDSMVTLFRHREAVECFLRARRRWMSEGVREAAGQSLDALAPIDDLRSRETLLCWKLAVSLERGLSEYSRALRWLEKGEEALPSGHKGLQARLLATKGAILTWLGRFREAVGVGEEGLSLARMEDDPTLLAYALYVLANAYAGLGMLDRAEQCDAESVSLYERTGDLAGLARAHVNLASSYFLKGELREALSHSEIGLALHSRVGNIRGVASQHHNVAGALLQLGDVDAALEHVEEALRLRGHEVVDPQVAGFALIIECKARVWSGDLEGAELALEEAFEILKGGDAGDLLDAGIIEAELRLAQGDPRRAEQAASRVLDLARSMEAELNEAQALYMLGRARLANGDPEAAVIGLQASRELAERIGAKYEHAQALAAVAEARAACAMGDPACEVLLGEAIDLFRSMGARYDLEKAVELRDRIARS
jgi:tetratricopeptide (TPR) repeat protein